MSSVTAANIILVNYLNHSWLYNKDKHLAKGGVESQGTCMWYKPFQEK